MEVIPVIGLTTAGRHDDKVVSKHYDSYFAIPAPYVDAVRRAGGIPVLLPPGEKHWESLLASLDGVILTGGNDVDPRYYAGNPTHPDLTPIDNERDDSELTLAQKVVQDTKHPTLCICRGMQVMNVALGGTLYEHIPDIRPQDIHRNPEDGWAYQPVTATNDSRIADMMGATDVISYSGHHQALKDLAPDLNITAQAPDGIIEAVELSGHPWLVAVQWHPEVSAAVDPTQQGIFDALVEAARQYKLQRAVVL